MSEAVETVATVVYGPRPNSTQDITCDSGRTVVSNPPSLFEKTDTYIIQSRAIALFLSNFGLIEEKRSIQAENQQNQLSTAIIIAINN